MDIDGAEALKLAIFDISDRQDWLIDWAWFNVCTNTI